MTFGSALYTMFVRCGKQMRELYETDSYVYNLTLLNYLALLALYKWSQDVIRLTEDPDYQLSVHQMRLSDSQGFASPTPTPGDGFKLTCPFMNENYTLPMSEDVLTAVRIQLATMSSTHKADQGFSGLPHILLGQPAGSAMGGLPRVVTTAHAPVRASTAMAPVRGQGRLGVSGESCEESDGDGDECAGELGNDEDEKVVWIEDLHAAQALGSEEYWEHVLGGVDNKRVTLSSKPADAKGKPTARGKIIRLPRSWMQAMYADFPKVRCKTTGAWVNVCIRYLCHPPLGPDGKPCGKTACSTDPKHPLHRPGENHCNRAHSTAEFDKEFRPGHAALALIHGGLRGLPTPTLPLQMEADNP